MSRIDPPELEGPEVCSECQEPLCSHGNCFCDAPHILADDTIAPCCAEARSVQEGER